MAAIAGAMIEALAEGVALAINTSRDHRAKRKAVTFVKASEEPLAQPQTAPVLLNGAPD